MCKPLRVGVFGAGAIGSYLGLCLSSAGLPVTLVGRPWLVEAAPSLRAYSLAGEALSPGADLQVTDNPLHLAGVDLILVTVKSSATEAITETLAQVANLRAPIVSFQNGLRNPERIVAGHRGPVSGGVVTFNVWLDDAGNPHQATRGPLFADCLDGEPAQRMVLLRDAFARASMTLELRRDMREVMAGKLLLNLVNGVAAATGMGLSELLANRDARWCYAACMREGLGVLRAAGFAPKTTIGLPPSVIARTLTLPGWLISPAIKRLAGPAQNSRSSTLQDLDRGRATEINELNGEICQRAAACGIVAPANSYVADVVHRHEARAMAGETPEWVNATTLRAEMTACLV